MTKKISAETKALALNLSYAGMSTVDIAEKCGVTRATVWVWLKAMRNQAESETIEIVTRRSIESTRLDTLQNLLWPDVLSGNLAASKAVLAIIQTRISLHGCAAPLQTVLQSNISADMRVTTRMDDEERILEQHHKIASMTMEELEEALRISGSQTAALNSVGKPFQEN